MSEEKQEQAAKSVNNNGGFLGAVERVGNALPDPAVLFIALLFIVWVLSWMLSYVSFSVPGVTVAVTPVGSSESTVSSPP